MASTSLAPQVPNNYDAERSILGAILLDNTSAQKLIESGFSGRHFFSTKHRLIFAAMLGMIDHQQPIDLVTLSESLHNRGQLESSGGAAYIASLTDGMPKTSTSNIAHYAKIVTEKSILREIISVTENIQKRAFEGRDGEDEGAGAVAEAALKAMSVLASNLSPKQRIVGGNGHLDYSLEDFLKAQFPVPEHLIEGLIPRNGSAMIVAMPHHLKSWFTIGMALGSTVPGFTMGKLEVKKPVRTYIITIEDFPGQVQWRMEQLLKASMFADCNRENVRVLPRPVGGLNIMDENCFQTILRLVESFKADHVIFDVMRRVFRGDINSPKECSELCEQFDRFRDMLGVSTTVVHHENRKGEDIMRASAGSFHLPGWANVLIQFKRKMQESNGISHVEIEVDNKLAQSLEPVRMVLDLASETPLRIEPVEDMLGIQELRDKLSIDWTVRDLSEALDVHKSNAQRRLKKLMSQGIAEKVVGGRRGRQGGLARFRFVGEGE